MPKWVIALIGLAIATVIFVFAFRISDPQGGGEAEFGKIKIKVDPVKTSEDSVKEIEKEVVQEPEVKKIDNPKIDKQQLPEDPCNAPYLQRPLNCKI